MDQVTIERECGIEYAVLEAWVQAQPEEGCSVRLEPMEPRTFGHALGLPRTYMRIEGPADAVQKLYRRFELRFLSAGG